MQNNQAAAAAAAAASDLIRNGNKTSLVRCATRRRLEGQEDEEVLPEDLIYGIFLLLPVKTLIQFRSLSKRWKKIITSPEFAKDHLLRQFDNSPTRSSSSSSILFIHPLSSNGASYIYSLTPLNDMDLVAEIEKLRHLPPPTNLSSHASCAYDYQAIDSEDRPSRPSSSNRLLTHPSFSCGASYLKSMKRRTDIADRIFRTSKNMRFTHPHCWNGGSDGPYSMELRSDYDIAHVLSASSNIPSPRPLSSNDDSLNHVLVTNSWANIFDSHDSLNHVLVTNSWANIFDSLPVEYSPLEDMDILRLESTKLNFPFQVDREVESLTYCSWIIYSSSCHGLLCMAHYDPRAGTAFVYVWNPLTGQSRQIPWPVANTGRSSVLSSYVGFGYDGSIDDYKIVVHTYDSNMSANRAQVMSLKTTTWRSIDKLGWGKRCSEPVVFDGDVYWISKSTGVADRDTIISFMARRMETECFFILKFNFAEERLTNLSLPFETAGWNASSQVTRLMQYFDGSLCCYYYNPHAETKASLWTLNPKDGTWNQLLKIPQFPSVYACYGLYPVGFTSKGDLILAMRTKYGLLVYLKEQKQIITIHLDARAQPQQGYGDVGIHLLQMETLISPNPC